jgi:uncharacterized membrane protein
MHILDRGPAASIVSGLGKTFYRRITTMDRKTVTGAVLAAAVGAMFLTTPVFAQSSSGSSTSGANVKCIGGNSCKGQSSCKTASSGCAGQNSCKGKGWVTTASAKVCTDKGGKPEAPTKSM